MSLGTAMDDTVINDVDLEGGVVLRQGPVVRVLEAANVVGSYENQGWMNTIKKTYI